MRNRSFSPMLSVRRCETMLEEEVFLPQGGTVLVTKPLSAGVDFSLAKAVLERLRGVPALRGIHHIVDVRVLRKGAEAFVRLGDAEAEVSGFFRTLHGGWETLWEQVEKNLPSLLDWAGRLPSLRGELRSAFGELSKRLRLGLEAARIWVDTQFTFEEGVERRGEWDVFAEGGGDWWDTDIGFSSVGDPLGKETILRALEVLLSFLSAARQQLVVPNGGVISLDGIFYKEGKSTLTVSVRWGDCQVGAAAKWKGDTWMGEALEKQLSVLIGELERLVRGVEACAADLRGVLSSPKTRKTSPQQRREKT